MKTAKKSILGFLCLTGMFTVGFISRDFVLPINLNIIPSVQAQVNTASGKRKCSSRTLQGAWGIKFDGQKIGAGPFVSVGRITFDGVGTFTTSEIGRFNGNPINRTFTGPYTVNEDCTGLLDFSSAITNPPHNAHGNFVIVDDGREFFVVDNEDGWAASGIGKRISKGEDRY